MEEAKKLIAEPIKTAENATTQPESSQTKATKMYREKKDGNLVLWVRLVLCVAILLVIYAMRLTGTAYYPMFRTSLRTELDAPGWYTGGSARDFLAFTQNTIKIVRESTEKVFSNLSGITVEQAAVTVAPRTLHRKSNLSFGYSEESYLPEASLIFPLTSGTMSVNSDYGARINPISGQETEFHGGVDLAAVTGDAIRAAADGVVRFSTQHESYGNYVRLVHSDCIETIYAHMQYIFVRAGQKVTAGQVLGTAGQTGNTTGPHLHFEILYKGVRYDPTEALRQAKSVQHN